MKLADTGYSVQDIKDKVSKYMIETYERFDFLAERAKDQYIYDEKGEEYLDFYAGIAVNSAGNCNEKFISDDKLFEYQSKIIRDLAEKESCVIVGKCADYVLRDKPNVVSVYIEAPRRFCVERTMENMHVSEEVAHATIERTDKFRADYYKYYTHGNYWTNPVNYDMTLNSERVGIDDCVKIIEQYLELKGYIKS